MKIFDIFHLDIVWNSAHGDQELVLGDLVGAFLRKLIEDNWEVNALLVVGLPRVLSQLFDRIPVLDRELRNPVLNLTSHGVDQMRSGPILVKVSLSVDVSFLNDLKELEVVDSCV